MREAAASPGGRTTPPLDFAPYGSIFVIFRKSMLQDRQGTASSNSPQLSGTGGTADVWTVNFAPEWGGPESIRFEKLCDWTKADVDGIKYYSGTATYTSEKFVLPESLILTIRPPAIYFDVGEVKNIARVRLNGQDLHVLWTRPFRVEITGEVQSRRQPVGNLGDQPLAQPPDRRRGAARRKTLHAHSCDHVQQGHATALLRPAWGR